MKKFIHKISICVRIDLANGKSPLTLLVTLLREDGCRFQIAVCVNSAQSPKTYDQLYERFLGMFSSYDPER